MMLLLMIAPLGTIIAGHASASLQEKKMAKEGMPITLKTARQNIHRQMASG